jgi:hypothetical protein
MTHSFQPGAPPPAGPIRTAIDGWFNIHIANSPVARSVDAYNHVRAVLPHLEASLVSLIEKEI